MSSREYSFNRPQILYYLIDWDRVNLKITSTYRNLSGIIKKNPGHESDKPSHLLALWFKPLIHLSDLGLFNGKNGETKVFSKLSGG